ncbi:hypothetical protein [Proteiniclasticum sp.]|uniref:hypothetical protein n=1 Tax=Proteiniclasticum sp. TaxID=2053595 RepID=UPI00289B2D5C|nr:hypothetical protein [Proteiniclasticum sp.]
MNSGKSFYAFLDEISAWVKEAIRTPKQMVDCALAGADIVTAGIEVYRDSFRHPFTDKGIGIFCEAWNHTVI